MSLRVITFPQLEYSWWEEDRLGWQISRWFVFLFFILLPSSDISDLLATVIRPTPLEMHFFPLHFFNTKYTVIYIYIHIYIYTFLATLSSVDFFSVHPNFLNVIFLVTFYVTGETRSQLDILYIYIFFCHAASFLSLEFEHSGAAVEGSSVSQTLQTASLDFSKNKNVPLLLVLRLVR